MLLIWFNRMDLNSARIFAHVIAKGSFSAASKSMGIPVATVSRRISELEDDLGMRLIERSTRRLRLTDAGSTLYDYVCRGVQEMEAGLLALSEQEANLGGSLRLSLPPSFEPMWDVLDSFSELYPRVEVDVFVSERRLDFIEDGIDIALRIGAVESLSAVARRLCSYRHVLVATPAFLGQHPIRHPGDILQVKTAAWSKKDQSVKWYLGEHELLVHPIVHANDYNHMRYIALRHRCVTELPPFFAKPYIKSGALVQVLPEHPMPEQTVQLVYPSRKSVSRITRAFIDYCVVHFKI